MQHSKGPFAIERTRLASCSLIAENLVSKNDYSTNNKQRPDSIASAHKSKSWSFWSKQQDTADLDGDDQQSQVDDNDQDEFIIPSNNTTSTAEELEQGSPDNVDVQHLGSISGESTTDQPARLPSQAEKANPIVRPNLVVPSLDECLEIWDNSPAENIAEKSAEIIKNWGYWKRLKAWWYSNPSPNETDLAQSRRDSEFSTASDGASQSSTPVSVPIPPPSPSPSPSPFSESFHPHHNQLHAHLFKTRVPHKISKVVIIGVHGFFPMRVIRSILGEPTGTSAKFANEAGAAFDRWARTHNLFSAAAQQLEITKIPLEGEGKVLDRVNDLYTILLGWVVQIKQADCVFFAAHSQGTPVAVHLLARLIEDGHVDSTKRLGLLGIAGVSLGPFVGFEQNPLLKAYSSFENASFRELFQFRNPKSQISQKYLDSLKTILRLNTKVVYVGSTNDQVVPLYSSTCMHVSHPNIFRAAYFDGIEVAPEFISDLISLALLLKNVGSTDHGLVKEISSSLSGSLRGNGHSSVYDEPAVYDLALRFMLETEDQVVDDVLSTPSSSASLPLIVDNNFRAPKVNQNPYVLPWTLHGLITEAASRPNLRQHLVHIVNEFSTWTPETKPLRNIKYRLGAVQSKL